MDLIEISTEQEAEIIKRHEQRKAEIKVQEKIANDVIRSVFEEFEEEFRNLDWKEHYIITRSYDGTSFPSSNNFSVSYNAKQMFKFFIKIKMKDGKQHKITFKDYDEIKEIVKQLFEMIRHSK